MIKIEGTPAEVIELVDRVRANTEPQSRQGVSGEEVHFDVATALRFACDEISAAYTALDSSGALTPSAINQLNYALVMIKKSLITLKAEEWP